MTKTELSAATSNNCILLTRGDTPELGLNGSRKLLYSVCLMIF